MFINWLDVLYFAMFVPLLIWAVWLALRWRALPGFAGRVYDSTVEKGLLSASIEREAYIKAYVRVEGPRLAVYRCAAGFVALLALPLLVSLFNWVWVTVWRLLGAVPGPYERGFMLHTFMTFVFVMAVLVGLLYLITAYYYRERPPTLASEIKRLEGEKR